MSEQALPECNNVYPAALKRAIGIPHDGRKAKPIGFVPYAGLAGGLRALEQLSPVFAELDVVSMRDTGSLNGALRRVGPNPGDRPMGVVGESAAGRPQ